ncbi:MAG: MXAN_5187 C-terminal domain-containing protein [Acidobacteriota bacterium]
MPVSIERDLDLLERSLTSLKVDYERFFAGDLKTPPVASRRKVDEILRRVGNVEVERAAERFRLQAVQGRFTALTELWDKRLSAKEEGRGLFRAPRPAAAAPPPPPPAHRPKSVSSDGEGSTSVKAVGRGDMKSLFDRFCAARAAAGEDVSKLRYDRFEDLVKKQAAEIRRTTGATRLAFEVQTREGKVRLVGRPQPAAAKGKP